MNSSFKSIENERNIPNKTPESSKKPKQLTLFDMKSKGKFSLECDPNVKQQAQASPVREKPAKKSRSSLNKKKLNSPSEKENKSIVEESECELIEIDDDQSTSKKISPTKRANISDFFTKSQSKTKETKKSPSSKKEPVVKAVSPVVKKTSVKKSKMADAKIENAKMDDIKTEEANEKDAKNSVYLTKFIRKNGQALLINEENNLNASEDDIKEEKSHGHYFGDSAAVIELNNILANIYATQNRSFSRKKPKNETESGNVLKKLDLPTFNQCILSNSAYVQLVKNVLTFLLQREGFCQNYKLFEVRISNFDLSPCFLQEICKIAVFMMFRSPDLLFNEKVVLTLDKSLLRKYKILATLNENNLETAFSNVDIASKIQLLRLLYDELLSCPVYEDHYGKCEKKVADLQATLDQGQREYSEILEIPINKLRLNKDQFYHQENDAKKKHMVQKLLSIEKNLKKEADKFNAIKRLVPLGTDGNQRTYWHFSFINGIVVEAKNQWYLFSTASKANELVQKLETYKENQELIANLKTKIETMFSAEAEVAMVEEPADKEEPAKEAEDTGEPPKPTDELKKYERRSTRSFTRKTAEEALSELVIDNDDDEREVQDCVMLEEDDEVNEVGTDWTAYTNKHFQTDSETYTIEHLLMYVINTERFIDYCGYTSVSIKSEAFRESVLEYNAEAEFKDRLNILKKCMTKLHEATNFRIVLSAIGTSGRYKHWKELVNNSESLSNLYLMAFIFTKMISWKFLSKKECKICNKSQPKFKILESLEEMKNEETPIGFNTCLKCDSSFHKSCISQDVGYKIIKSSDSYQCSKCVEQKLNFFYAEKSQAQKNAAELDVDEYEEKGDHKLRVRRHVCNYKELNTKELNALMKSKDKEGSDSSRESVSSYSSGSKSSSRKRSARSIKEKKKFKPESMPTRRSTRASCQKRATYAPADTESESQDSE